MPSLHHLPRYSHRPGPGLSAGLLLSHPSLVGPKEPAHSRNSWLWKDAQKQGREGSWENKKSQMLAICNTLVGDLQQSQLCSSLVRSRSWSPWPQAQLVCCLLGFSVQAGTPPLHLHCFSSTVYTPTSSSFTWLNAASRRCSSQARFP